jgi:hypothetical protein
MWAQKISCISPASETKPYLVPRTAYRPVPSHRHYCKDSIRVKVFNYFTVRYKPIIYQIYLEIRHKFWFESGSIIYSLFSGSHTMWNVWTMLCQSTSLLRLTNFPHLQYTAALLHSSYWCQSSSTSRMNVIQQTLCLRNVRQPWGIYSIWGELRYPMMTKRPVVVYLHRACSKYES